jgi:hypothetical protein
MTVYSYDRRIADADERQKARAHQVCRGFHVDVDIRRKDLDWLDKLKEGRLTLSDLLKKVPLRTEDVGIWWFLMTDSSWIEDAQDYALDETELVQGDFVQNWLEEFQTGESDEVGLQIPIVLIAKRPKGWDPDENPEEMGGLMGNSYIDPNRWPKVRLEKVQYYDGKDRWRTLSAGGLTVRL